MAKKLSISDALDRPVIPKGSHPVQSRKLLVPTPDIYHFLETIDEWLMSGVPGGIVTAPPRFGKSRAIRFYIEVMKQRAVAAEKRQEETDEETITAVRIDCKGYKSVTESMFYRNWLRCLKHAEWAQGTAEDKFDRLIKYLVSLIDETPSNKIIIFIDEAQKMSDMEFQWLCDIFNSLEEEGAAPLFVLVGQPELLSIREDYQNDLWQIVGRFMTVDFEFLGVRHPEELRVCLEGFDDVSEYPEGSGWAYSKYFFPVAFTQGWRLASEAEMLWSAFEEVHIEEHKAGNLVLPMQYVMTTIRLALQLYTTWDDAFTKFNKAQWKDSIRRSGYVGAGRYYGPPEEPEGDEDED